MNSKGNRHRSSHRPPASRIARLIAEDFFGDALDLDSRDMSREAPGGLMPATGAGREQGAEGRTWLGMPEVEVVRAIRRSATTSEAGQDSTRLFSVRTSQRVRFLGGNDRVVRLFLTFISAMDRVRDATQLWRAGMSLFEERPELFDPQHAAGMEFGTLHALLKSTGVSRKHGQDTGAWIQVASTLARCPESPVRQVIYAGRGDAQELLRDLRTRDEGGHLRFPLLGGPKIRLMWIRMMVNPGGAVIGRIDTVPVAVDAQVRRATENLGVTATRGLPLRKAKPVIHQAWLDALSEVEIGGPPGIADTCAALDPALWFFGRHGCSHCEKAGRKVRFGRACDHCVRFNQLSSTG